MLNSPSNLSFKFGAKFTEMDKKFTLARNAIDELTNRVNNISALNIDAELDALNSKIITNTEDITDLESTKADISYIDNLMAEITSKVDTNTNNITTLNIDLNALTSKVDTNTTTIKKHDGWINNLVSSVAYNKENPFNDFYKHLFDMIYPIGSIYTTITDTAPPNIYDMSGNAYAKWEPLAEGRFLRNTQANDKLNTTGGTPTTQLPAHTHTTNVTINGELYSGSNASVNSDRLINCTLFATKKVKEITKDEQGYDVPIYYENVFYNADSSVTLNNNMAVNWVDPKKTDGKKSSRTASSGLDTETYFPIKLSVNKDYATNSESTTAANKTVKVIPEDTLPDNCPPYIYVKMYERTR